MSCRAVMSRGEAHTRVGSRAAVDGHRTPGRACQRLGGPTAGVERSAEDRDQSVVRGRRWARPRGHSATRRASSNNWAPL